MGKYNRKRWTVFTVHRSTQKMAKKLLRPGETIDSLLVRALGELARAESVRKVRHNARKRSLEIKHAEEMADLRQKNLEEQIRRINEINEQFNKFDKKSAGL